MSLRRERGPHGGNEWCLNRPGFDKIPSLPVLLEPLDLDEAVARRHPPRQTQPSGSPGAVVTTSSPSRATRRVCTVLSRPCPGSRSRPSRASTPAMGGGCGAPPEAVQAPKWVDFPAAAQVLQVQRTRTIKGRKHVEVAYLICSLPMEQAQPEQVAAWVQGHWGIENRLHVGP